MGSELRSQGIRQMSNSCFESQRNPCAPLRRRGQWYEAGSRASFRAFESAPLLAAGPRVDGGSESDAPALGVAIMLSAWYI